jgi:hypothetical protein
MTAITTKKMRWIRKLRCSGDSFFLTGLLLDLGVAIIDYSLLELEDALLGTGAGVEVAGAVAGAVVFSAGVVLVSDLDFSFAVLVLSADFSFSSERLLRPIPEGERLSVA